MLHDVFSHQLPDADPPETQEWIESLDAVIARHGPARARFLVSRMLERAGQRDIGTPVLVQSPYVNTIAPVDEPWFPGDEHIERRIRAFIRWNAAVMVLNANRQAEGIGGHLSTFASSAALYEVGFNHFFRGKDDGLAGDHIYFQGHASSGIYARAYLEGRLEESQLDRFRREIGGGGLSSYPHPRLMPDFWEFPTVSMGIGPINSIYHARFLRYLKHRRIADTADSRVWCFVGDGEVDEPETLGSISLGGREGLDNLIWVVNCNLQRLDGPVRGNGKIIQELEAMFRGAGWHVIKVIWGTGWDELIAADIDGVLVDKMNATVDGDYQRYAASDGAHIREHFFGPDPRLRKMVEHLTDEELRNLPRGGHDYRKLYAAYKRATELDDAPVAILTKTIKGWTLGSEVEARNATHQIKKMSTDQLLELRTRLHLHDEISEEALRAGEMPYYRPPEGSPEHTYLQDRRKALDGYLPHRPAKRTRPLELPDDTAFEKLDAGSGGREVSTTMAFTQALRDLMRDERFGHRVVPIVADEARTFGMDPLFREFGIYAAKGQLYTPVDAEMMLSYKESQDGQLLEEGITEAGSLASFIAAGTADATQGVPMVPFFTFYSMFGFQRVGDLIWAAADARARGFLMGATAGRTTLFGEGLQHQDGHSHVLASTVPVCRAYDPAFAYEMGAILRDGLHCMYGPDEEDVFYYLTIYNENYEMPSRPDGVTDDDITGGLYRWADAPGGVEHRATILFSGVAHAAARAARHELAEHHGVGVDLWSATSYKSLREDALAAERRNRLHPSAEPEVPRVSRLLADVPGPVVAVTDYMAMVPDQIARWVPDSRRFTPLGTDGFGRSDTSEALRRFFEVDAGHVAAAVLAQLDDADGVREAQVRHGIDPDSEDPHHG
jgi:pyruvate dehydrogenase E1 component